MNISEFIDSLPTERKITITEIHETILANDPSVTPVIKPMMGKEMILYEERCYMKYGLASTKNHMSLHCLPMYMKPELHAKYVPLLPDAKFQKGCINFTDGATMPLAILTELVVDCSFVNIAEVLEIARKNNRIKIPLK